MKDLEKRIKKANKLEMKRDAAALLKKGQKQEEEKKETKSNKPSEQLISFSFGISSDPVKE